MLTRPLGLRNDILFSLSLVLTSNLFKTAAIDSFFVIDELLAGSPTTPLLLLPDEATGTLVLTRSAQVFGAGRAFGEAGFEVSAEATEPSAPDCSDSASTGTVEPLESVTLSADPPISEDKLAVFPFEWRESDGILGITGTTGSIFPPFRAL